MTEVSAKKQIWRGLRFSARSIWMLFLATSLMANVALGVTNFVLQPLWRAAAVLSATAAVKTKAKIEERKAVAKAKTKEKSKGRIRRVAVAVPMVGVSVVRVFGTKGRLN